ncbi:MAG: prepilin-type cleavage/methylation domain-containing protein [Hydrogenobaculum sp.]|nr:MAG: prepilin-type cleavage/methylation domain-containing protein [Hydrogenobaculum sp.]
MCRYSKSGYTLIEIIIAVAIFSMMVFLGTTALTQGLRQYKNILSRGLNFWQNAKYVWLTKSAGSMLDYYVKSPYGWAPFFRGKEDYFEYVSTSPIANSLPVVALVKVHKNKKGKYDIIYYEKPVYTMYYEDLINFYELGDYKKSTSIRLFKNLSSVKLRYYGYNIQTREYNWYKNYSALKQKILPTLIKVSYKKHKKKHTIILGVNNNSLIKGVYGMIYLFGGVGEKR